MLISNEKLYTDTIVFAPLSSSFHSSFLPSGTFASNSPPPSSSQTSLMLPPSSGEQSSVYHGGTTKEPIGPPYSNKPPQDKKESIVQGPRTRRQWLKEWESNNPGRVLPCSAKAVYRLADSKNLNHIVNLSILIIITELDLTELKNRAFQVYTCCLSK